MKEMDHSLASSRWDALYRNGRYAGDPPVSFVNRIPSALDASSLLSSTGLYIGCGNGRNYLPLVHSGLRLYGLDLSKESLRQLADLQPVLSEQLICADFRKYSSQRRYGYIIAIQVFQHGFEADAVRYFTNVASTLSPGGLFFFGLTPLRPRYPGLIPL